jgi:hypothetical protein
VALLLYSKVFLDMAGIIMDLRHEKGTKNLASAAMNSNSKTNLLLLYF